MIASAIRRWIGDERTSVTEGQDTDSPVQENFQENSAREVGGQRAAADGPPRSYEPLEQELDEERELRLAIARTTIGVTMRAEGTCKVEESVYGAAIVMPQLARTAGWDKTMTIFAIQSWTFLLLNVLLQAYLLRMLAKEEDVMDAFGGQMYLCDFGAHAEACPGPGCRGPGGTDITGPRLYRWDAIVNRMFVKDSLKALLPDRIAEINELVDVGEYGIESYWCRCACCFIFMVSCQDEFAIIFKMLQLLWKIPNVAEPWIQAKPRTDERLVGLIDEVRVVIAGMPIFWKVFNLFIVVVPKFMLWKLTAETGVTILMETAGIDDIITNSVGLTFILGLDELIGSALMQEETLNFVAACEEFDLYEDTTSCVGDMTVMSDNELLEKYTEVQRGGPRSWNIWDLLTLAPTKLIISLAGTGFFVMEYYARSCVQNKDDANRWVSRSMYLPSSLTFGWGNAFLPDFFPIEREGSPYWKMPETGQSLWR